MASNAPVGGESGRRVDARARILRFLVRSGATSRAALARGTSLAPSTVSAIVGELQAEGLVVEPDAPRARAGLGRPPTLLKLHRSAGVALGIDFGKRHVRVALADLAHDILAERHSQLDADLPAGEAIALAVTLVDDVLGVAGARRDDVVGIGMGIPGPLHGPAGELGDSTILPGWVGVRSADAMSEALGLPVEVGNDANLGALSEWTWGVGRGVTHMAYLKVATGVGAGLIVGGKPYVGAGGTAGELGHTIVDPDGAPCRCGNRGCLETLAGAPAVLAALGNGLTIGEAIARAGRGDADCRRVIADAGRAVGTAAAGLCNLLNPELLVVGGDLGAAGHLLLDPLREALGRAAIRSAADDVEVVEGALGERAEVLGAVALGLRQGAERLSA